MKSRTWLIVLFTAGLLLPGCYYDIALEREFTGEVSFGGDVLPIFNQSCNNAACHAAGAVKPDLSPANAYNALISENYVNVASPEASELYQWMLGQRAVPMPLSGPNPNYNALVLAWIRQGAPNN